MRGTLKLVLLMTTCVVILALVFSVIDLPFLGRDFISFWTGAQAIRTGHSPYDQAFQTAIQQANRWDVRVEMFPFHPYVYPPWLAILLWPLAWLPYRMAFAVWLALNLVLGATGLGLLMAVLRPRGLRYASPVVWLAAFLYLPLLHGLVVGQPHLLLFFLMALVVWGSVTGHDGTAGVALGVMSIKPQVGLALAAVFGLVWLIRRRWRALLSLILTGLMCVAISFVLLPNWMTDMLAAPDQFVALTGLPLLPSGFRDYPTLYAAIQIGLASSPALLLAPIVAAGMLPLAIYRFRRRQMTWQWFSALACSSLVILTPYARVYELTLLLWPMLYILFSAELRAPRGVRVSLVASAYLWPLVLLVAQADGVWNVWAAILLTLAMLTLPRAEAAA